jgi:hypothetical protein
LHGHDSPNGASVSRFNRAGDKNENDYWVRNPGGARSHTSHTYKRSNFLSPRWVATDPAVVPTLSGSRLSMGLRIGQTCPAIREANEPTVKLMSYLTFAHLWYVAYLVLVNNFLRDRVVSSTDLYPSNPEFESRFGDLSPRLSVVSVSSFT